MSEVNQEIKYVDSVRGGKNLILRGELTESSVEAIIEGEYRTLILDTGFWPDLRVLVENRKKIVELWIREQHLDWSAIARLSNLHYLKVDGWFKAPLDFTLLTNLRFLDTYWNDGYEDSLYMLPCLEVVQLRGWKEPDCRKLGNLPSLKFFQCIDAGRLESLQGIGSCSALQWLCIDGAKKLTEISALRKLKNLRHLELANCKRITDIEQLKEVLSLRQLRLINCGDLTSIRWIKKNANLELFATAEKIEDGDLSVLLEMPSLKGIGVRNAKNHSHNMEEIQEVLDQKWGKRSGDKCSEWTPLPFGQRRVISNGRDDN